MKPLSTRIPVASLMFFMISSLLHAQADNPLQGSVTRASGSPRTNSGPAEIIPLIWNAKIGDANIAVPLSSIDHYGVQDYTVDGAVRVRELTITTKSLSMIRIYHLSPVGGGRAGIGERLDKARALLENTITKDDPNLPIKTYPVTTHEKMVEYRVSEGAHISELWEHLNGTMVTYMGRVLTPEQRPQVVSKVEVLKSHDE